MVFLLLGTSGAGIQTAISPELKAMNHDAMDGNNSNSFSGNSFHGKTTLENANWYIINISSNETIYIEDINVNITYSNVPTYKWSVVDRFFMINPEKGEYWNYPVFGMLKNSKWYELYLHLNWPINFTYNHTTKRSQYEWTSLYYLSNVTLSSGIWYVVCMAAPTEACHIQISINHTNANIGNATEGSSSFLLENEDLHAKLNLKSVPLSVILGGKKSIHINNTFVGFIYAPTSIGIAYTKYVAPNGTAKEAISWDILININTAKNSDFIPIFEPIWGENGIWTFYTSMIGTNRCTVNVFGADVKLP